MSLALLFLAMFAIIALELRVLAPIMRRELHAERLAQSGPHTTALRTLCLEVVSGDPVGTSELRGTRDGLSILVHQRTKRTPPWEGVAEPVTCVELDATLPAQLVCPASDADKPGPSWMRGPPTGTATFDERYAIFCPRTDGDAEGAPYRGDAVPSASWASPTTLEALAALSVRWLSVQDGKLELAVAQLMPADLPPVLDCAVTLVGHDASLPPLPLPARLEPGLARKMAVDLAVWSAVAGVFGIPVFFILEFLLPFASFTERYDCGPGHHMVTSTAGYSTSGTAQSMSWRLDCDDGGRHPLLLHFLVMFVLFLVLSPATMLASIYYKRYLRSLEGPTKS